MDNAMQETKMGDNTMASTQRSRSLLEISAAYVNVAMRSGLTVEELQKATTGQSNEITARAYAVSMNLAFAVEVAIKGKLTEEVVEELRRNKKGHDLVELFGSLTHLEQEKIRMDIEIITGLNGEQFERMLNLCRNGFEDWRYFFEKGKASKPYNYFGIISFLYALVYSLIASEGKEEAMEDSFFKKQAYVGETGLFLRQRIFKNELEEAVHILQQEGKTELNEPDREWIGRILKDLQETVKQIARVKEGCDKKHGRMNIESLIH